jgi:hyperosmotically inducible protein
MKTTLAVTYLAVASLLGPVAAIAADAATDPSKPVVYVKDSVITTKIKAELAAKHIDSLGNIHVDTDQNGVVYLSGTAHTQAAVDQAVSMARATEGVKSVHSTLAVKKDD